MKRLVFFVCILVLATIACGQTTTSGSTSRQPNVVPSTPLPDGDIKIDIKIKNYEADKEKVQEMTFTAYVGASQPEGGVDFMGVHLDSGTSVLVQATISEINNNTTLTLSDGYECRKDRVESGSNPDFARLHFMCP